MRDVIKNNSDKNIYYEQVKNVLPRVLALFDADASSKSYGLGDRYHWAWGLIDFPNATFQGAVHGFARLWVAGLWPYKSDAELFLQRIDSIICATANITRHDGSLEEAFPNEGSYCVTALVAYDLICTIELLNDHVDSEKIDKWKIIISPLIGYLVKADEEHAIISNHLATAAAALYRWNDLTGNRSAEAKANILLKRILRHQSCEGWYKEYEGADPGYQSLCTYYLADINILRPGSLLEESLKRSVEFLTYFAHPDGSFGGIYGSRSTRFYCPAGIKALSATDMNAAKLAEFMEESILSQTVVSLVTIDEPNLVPFFNSYCWSAVLKEENDVPKSTSNTDALPSNSDETFRRIFYEAGLVLDKGKCHYSVINFLKGGIVYHFKGGKLSLINSGLCFTKRDGSIGSTQYFDAHREILIDDGEVIVDGRIVAMPKKLPNISQFIILRLMALTIFRNRFLREIVKKILVRYIITNKKYWPIKNKRKILLGEDLNIIDQSTENKEFEKLEKITNFVPYHMASKGYWQIQDEFYK